MVRCVVGVQMLVWEHGGRAADMVEHRGDEIGYMLCRRAVDWASLVARGAE